MRERDVNRSRETKGTLKKWVQRGKSHTQKKMRNREEGRLGYIAGEKICSLSYFHVCAYMHSVLTFFCMGSGEQHCQRILRRMEDFFKSKEKSPPT